MIGCLDSKKEGEEAMARGNLEKPSRVPLVYLSFSLPFCILDRILCRREIQNDKRVAEASRLYAVK